MSRILISYSHRQIPALPHHRSSRGKLISREQELALLDLAFTRPHTAIASLIGWDDVNLRLPLNAKLAESVSGAS